MIKKIAFSSCNSFSNTVSWLGINFTKEVGEDV